MSQLEQEKQAQKTNITKGWGSRAERTRQAHSGPTPLILQMRKPGLGGQSGLPRNWAAFQRSDPIPSITVWKFQDQRREAVRQERWMREE